MTNTFPELPKKLSENIHLAVDDLNKIEKNPKYEIDMGIYHCIPIGNSKCSVCFAGAVMAQTLKANIDKEYFPFHFKTHNNNVLNALDDIRNYHLSSALYELDIKIPITQEEEILKNIDIIYYGDNKTKFKRNMRTIANRLAKMGY